MNAAQDQVSEAAPMRYPEITFNQSEGSAYYARRVPYLKQSRAREWRGPCPIHHGKNDNFSVNSETGLWFCHSRCNRGGDILALEEELFGGDFPARQAKIFRLVGPTEEPNGARRTRAGGRQ